MKIIGLTILLFQISYLPSKVYKYQADCGQEAQWINGVKSCSIYDTAVFLTIHDEPEQEEFCTFRLKVQSISSDTLHVTPRNMQVTRVYENGRTDSVSIENPEFYIDRANRDIKTCEKEINIIVKTNNTENATIGIIRSIPGSNKINTNTQASKAIYQEKLTSAQNKLLDAKETKAFWETQALRANTVYPLSFVEQNIYFKPNNCIKAVLHISIQDKVYDFLILKEEVY